MSRYDIAAFYVFAPVEASELACRQIKTHAGELGLKGTTIVAAEGFNGTMSGQRQALEAYLAALKTRAQGGNWEIKWSQAEQAPFRRLKVRLKGEIVTMGVDALAPTDPAGRYVEPEEWDELLTADDVVVIDTRNTYETDVGRFEGAVAPGTDSFREFPSWWKANRDKYKGKRVAMYCTGGIRCEKATRYLIGEGVPEVMHLQGGILRYLEETSADQSSWEGACFVFDGRVAVEHGLRETPHVLCHACGRPVSAVDQEAPEFVKGVQCPACKDDYSDDDRARFAMRQRQMEG